MKSGFSCPKIHPKTLGKLLKTCSMYREKSEDTITYLQNDFRVSRSLPMTPSRHPSKFMKFHKFSKFINFFDFFTFYKTMKSGFSCPKIHPKRLVSFWKHAQCIEGSLRILLHTYKMILGRLDPILSSKDKNVEIGTQATFWRALQYSKFKELYSWKKKHFKIFTSKQLTEMIHFGEFCGVQKHIFNFSIDNNFLPNSFWTS